MRSDRNILFTNRKRDSSGTPLTIINTQLSSWQIKRTVSLTCRRNWWQQCRSASHNPSLWSHIGEPKNSLTHAWSPIERCSVVAILCLATHHFTCLHTFVELFSNTWMAVGVGEKKRINHTEVFTVNWRCIMMHLNVRKQTLCLFVCVFHSCTSTQMYILAFVPSCWPSAVSLSQTNRARLTWHWHSQAVDYYLPHCPQQQADGMAIICLATRTVCLWRVNKYELPNVFRCNHLEVLQQGCSDCNDLTRWTKSLKMLDSFHIVQKKSGWRKPIG